MMKLFLKTSISNYIERYTKNMTLGEYITIVFLYKTLNFKNCNMLAPNYPQGKVSLSLWKDFRVQDIHPVESPATLERSRTQQTF